MSDYRKDSFVAIKTQDGVLIGTITGMNRNAGKMIVKAHDGNEATYVFEPASMVKLTKAEYTSYTTNGVDVSSLFQAPVDPFEQTQEILREDIEAAQTFLSEDDVEIETNQQVDVEPVVVSDANSANETDAVKSPKKAEIARQLFVRMMAVDGTKRKDVINAFITDLGLTKQGANTYYYNCTKARKAGNL